MMSMQEMFYGAAEPVWIVKPEKEDNKKADSNSNSVGKKPEAERADYSNFSSIPYYPQYYPEYVPPLAKQEESQRADCSTSSSIPYYTQYYPEYVPPPPKKEEPSAKKETRVVMKVPICCEECEELVEAALYRMKGVKSVECNTRRERVTVIATTAAPSDILMACRKVFRKSKMWSGAD